MKLTDVALRTLATPGRHFDGHGLYLEVTPAGGRYWRLKYRFAGKEKRLALGVYPAVTLKEARRRATEARERLDAGVDPGAERKAAKAQIMHDAANTLRLVAGEWLAHQSARWTPDTARRIRRALELHVFPELGERALADIAPSELQAVIIAIERRGTGETAARALQWVKGIYRWARVHGRIEVNQMTDLQPAELLKPRDVRSRLMLPAAELPTFLSALDHYAGDLATVCALRLVILTAARPGEVRGARWSEFDLAGARWIIPAARMKMRSEHLVPLSRQALSVLGDMHRLSGARELVFPSPSYASKPISENTLNSALARLGYKGVATAHGFRSLFSTLANESGKWRPDVIERQLAHKEANAVRAVYHRSAYIRERTKLMQWWADELDQCRIAPVVNGI